MGYLVLNLGSAVRSKWSDLRIIKTRDIKVSPPEEFPATEIKDIPQKEFHATLWGGKGDTATKACKTCGGLKWGVHRGGRLEMVGASGWVALFGVQHRGGWLDLGCRMGGV